jgi:hypothetical protein
VYFPAYSLTLLGARLTGLAFSERQTAAALPAAVASILVAGALAASTWPTAIPDRRFEPLPADRAAAARFLEKIRALPGPLFIPFHPYYPVLAGSPPHVHRMGVLDVAAQLGRPAGLDQALAEGRFAHVILDWKSQPWEWPTLEGRYHEVHQFTDGVDAVRAFSGAETSPRRLLARPPPPRRWRRGPAGAGLRGRLAGLDHAGDAFGGGPAPAQAGMYGRAAADSRRLGPAVEGTLSSPPLRLDRPRLRFRLDGPADPGLRVLLLDGPEAARSRLAHGKPMDIEWDVAALKGRPLTLVVEDRSATGGLAIDEIVSY